MILKQGIEKFRQEQYPQLRERFHKLANGQEPRVLFITCSDSRIVPSLITQTGPGELFVIRNAGNLVPPYAAAAGSGESGSLEYAVSVLKVTDIVVCGHSDCGAMKAVVSPKVLDSLPEVRNWLRLATPTRQAVLAREGDDRVEFAIAHNVKTQLENLKTHPCVSARLKEGDLWLHGWIYHIASGQIDVLKQTREAVAITG
ncbi:MAG: carbonic anhydrase [Vulcanimicrobiota bacterium]